MITTCCKAEVRRTGGWLAVACAAAMLIVPVSRVSQRAAAAERTEDSRVSSRSLPLLFERTPDGSIVARSRAYGAEIHPDGAELSLDDRSVRLTFVAGAAESVLPERQHPMRVNYMIGPPSGWRTNVPTFARVRVPQVYDGVDVIFYGTDRQLEYDFELAPGVRPDRIAVRIAGADALALDEGGDLRITVGDKTLLHHHPVAFQERAGMRVPVTAGYVLADGVVRFDLGDYDPALPLVIDPVISYSTYFGATGYDGTRDVAVDGAGNALIVGWTRTGGDFPVPSLRPKPSSTDVIAEDTYVVKMAPDGTPLWMTFYGGSDRDFPADIASGPDGDVIVAGTTQSADFPTTAGAYDTTPGTGVDYHAMDAFVLRLSADGTQVRYATRLGGNLLDIAYGVTVDATGRAYVGGRTESADFPVTTGGAGLASDEVPDGFVTRLSADGSRIEMSRFVAGNKWDIVKALALDRNGDIYLAGGTTSDVFPVRNAIRSSKFEFGTSDGDDGWDAFAMRLSPEGEIRFATYLGGMSEDSLDGIGLGPDGSIYLGGHSLSDAFTGVSGRRPNSGSFNADAVVLRLAGDGSRALSGRYFGGTAHDDIKSLAVDRVGVVSVAGVTFSSDFPQAPALSPRGFDGFVVQFLPDLWDFHRPTRLGGSDFDFANGVAIDARGDIWAVGETYSSDYPLVNPVQSARKGPGPDPDGVITKISCEIDFSETPHRTIGPEGGTGTIDIRMDPGCLLQPRTTVSWIHITAVEPTKIQYTVDPHSGSVSREGWIIVKDDWGTRVTQRAAGAPPPGSATEIVLNADDVSLMKGSWVFDTDAFDEHFIVRQRDAGRPKIAPALASPEHYFEMTFHAEAGRPYRLWVLGNAQDRHWANDSVHVQFSGSVDGSGRALYRIGSTSSAEVNLEDCSGCGVPANWSWEDNGWGSPGALGLEIRFASTGLQTLRVQTREDGMSVGQIVLSAEKYLRSTPPEDEWIAAPGGGTGGGGTEQVRYARDAGSVNGAWRFVADTTAAQGERLAHPDVGAAKLNAPLAAPANYVDFTVTVEAGRPYRLWLRLKAERNYWGNDSVWVQFTNSMDTSGNPLARVGSTTGLSVNLEECSGCGLDAWGWRDDGWGRSSAPLGTQVVFATAGPQTIRVQTREDGVSFDQLVLSADAYMNVPPGNAKRDTTILER